ncbi:MAG: 5'-nucleotidase [Spirochaetaceae bacterium]|jgi:5'(3')-deoxyribonucleotidase|nr:5'-nucleotidase [Spirochaetaceae bacterium]
MEENPFILGVDLDGVVADFYKQLRIIAAEWLDKPLETLTTKVTFGLDEWGLDEYGGYEKLHRFAITERNLFRKMEPIKDAPSVLRKLSLKGVRIRIITHRLFLKYFHKTSIVQTVEWLDSYDIPYWDICFMKDKGAVGAHAYIDDAPQNIINLRAKGCYTIVFSNATNLHLDGPRANNWREAEALVMESMDEWRTGSLTLFGAEGFSAPNAP